MKRRGNPKVACLKVPKKKLKKYPPKDAKQVLPGESEYSKNRWKVGVNLL